LAQKLRNSEDNNRYSSINTQSTIEIYREEINTLKVQIAQINELYNRENNSQDKEEEISYLKQSVSTLSDTVKQYEEQLIQAQNHIIYL
jgi:multidrug resistance efflux pump